MFCQQIRVRIIKGALNLKKKKLSKHSPWKLCVKQYDTENLATLKVWLQNFYCLPLNHLSRAVRATG